MGALQLPEVDGEQVRELKNEYEEASVSGSHDSAQACFRYTFNSFVRLRSLVLIVYDFISYLLIQSIWHTDVVDHYDMMSDILQTGLSIEVINKTIVTFL